MPSSEIIKIQTKLQPVFEQYKGQILFAYCFGSTVTNDRSLNSDIDLAFYARPELADLELKLRLITDCMRVLKRNDVDAVILNSLKNLVVAYSIVRDGVVLYDLDRVLREEYEVSISHRALDFLTQRKAVMGF